MVEGSTHLVATPVPALVDLLTLKEREKGSALTEAEVVEIRDKAVCMMLPVSERIAMDQARGYADLDPKNVWEQWQAVRQKRSREQRS